MTFNGAERKITPTNEQEFIPHVRELMELSAVESYRTLVILDEFQNFLSQKNFLKGFSISSIESAHVYPEKKDGKWQKSTTRVNFIDNITEEKFPRYVEELKSLNRKGKELSFLRIDFSKNAGETFCCDMGTMILDTDSLYIEVKEDNPSSSQIIDWVKGLENSGKEILFNKGKMKEKIRVSNITGEKFSTIRLTF